MDPTARCLRRRGAVTRALALAALGLAGCSTFKSKEGAEIDATVSYWRPEPHGDVEVMAGTQPGTADSTSLSHDLELGLDDQWLGRLDVEVGKHRFGFEYLPIRMHGTGAVDVPFTFHGATYPAGDFVTTDLDLITYALRWDYLLEAKKNSPDALRVGIGAWYWGFDAHVKGSNSGNNEHRSFSQIYPGVQASWLGEVGKDVFFTADVAYALDAIDSRIYDLAAGLAYKISDGGRLTIGYRYITWDFKEHTNDGDFNLRGPYAALTFVF